MEKTEYEKGYEAGYHDGAKDCQKLYGKILDYVCSMFQEAVCFRNRKRKKNTKNEWIDVKKDEKRLKEQ